MRDQPELPEGDRTYSVVCRRYKRARWVAAAAGALVTALATEAVLAWLWMKGFAPDESFAISAVLLLLLGTVIPWLLVEGLWRWVRRRYFSDWQ